MGTTTINQQISTNDLVELIIDQHHVATTATNRIVISAASGAELFWFETLVARIAGSSGAADARSEAQAMVDHAWNTQRVTILTKFFRI